MLWKEDTQICLLSLAANHIDVPIRWNLMDEEWWFTGLYGFPETQDMLKTYDLIRDLWQHSDLAWFMGGDLKEI